MSTVTTRVRSLFGSVTSKTPAGAEKPQQVFYLFSKISPPNPPFVADLVYALGAVNGTASLTKETQMKTFSLSDLATPICPPLWFQLDTQYRENYGAHCWDGTGDCPQHWKFKGGSTYFIHADSAEEAEQKWADGRAAKGFKNNEYHTEHVIDIQEGKGDPRAMSAEEAEQCEVTADGKPYNPANREMLNDN